MSGKKELKLYSANNDDGPDIQNDCDCDCKAPAVPLILRSLPSDQEPHMEQCDCKSASAKVVFHESIWDARSDSVVTEPDLGQVIPTIIQILPLYAK
jgi:hypothetical protein